MTAHCETCANTGNVLWNWRMFLAIRPPYITISGATAPGDGVCLAGNTVERHTHDVVIRHMRFRRGDRWVGDRNDSMSGQTADGHTSNRSGRWHEDARDQGVGKGVH